MLRLTRIRATVLAALLTEIFGFAGIARAHHSFAMFDTKRTVTIEGTVKEFQWTSPHAWIELMVSAEDGAKQYSVECHNLRVLGNAGWKFNTLKPGDKVTLEINPLRNGEPGGFLQNAHLPDGRTLPGF